MGWQSEREQWNAEGMCAREACKGSLKRGRGTHRATGLQYCIVCTRLLNNNQPGHPVAFVRAVPPEVDRGGGVP